jgi:hypothetical protein
MKVNSIISVLALSATAFASPKPKGHKHLPTTVIAGVEVVDTQIVRDAHALITKFPEYLYFHSIRTWLFGAATINANATLKAEVDLEAHALGAILHDLGWDSTYSELTRLSLCHIVANSVCYSVCQFSLGDAVSVHTIFYIHAVGL